MRNRKQVFLGDYEPITCSACDAVVPEDARVCPSCGAAFENAPPPPIQGPVDWDSPWAIRGQARVAMLVSLAGAFIPLVGGVVGHYGKKLGWVVLERIKQGDADRLFLSRSEAHVSIFFGYLSYGTSILVFVLLWWSGKL
jgi:hypothetical protein